MIHVIGNAAVDSVIRVAALSAARRNDRALGARPKILAARAPIRRSSAARCGADVRLVAAIGADAHGERIRSKLARRRSADGRLGDLVMRHATAASLRSIAGARTRSRASSTRRAISIPIAETPIDAWIMPRRLGRHAGQPAPGRHARAASLWPSRRERRRRSIRRRPMPLGTTTGSSSISSFVNRGEAIELAGRAARRMRRGRLARRAQARSLSRSAPKVPLSSRPSDAFRVAAPVIEADRHGRRRRRFLRRC